jgi:SpoVK/Ycf46/Vps4 family AAA+-type ATPase
LHVLFGGESGGSVSGHGQRAPLLLYVEKGLSGDQASGPTDSGVSARTFGTLLSYLNDHDSDVYFVRSANDVSKLPPEFTRTERFDANFFLDLPAQREKEQIWRLYLGKFGLDPAQWRQHDRDWTGAEVHACCRLPSQLDVPRVEAASNIVPVAVTAGPPEPWRRGGARGVHDADVPRSSGTKKVGISSCGT